MKKSFRVGVFTLLTMLLMTLSTGCTNQPDPTVASTLPIVGEETLIQIETTTQADETIQEETTLAEVSSEEVTEPETIQLNTTNAASSTRDIKVILEPHKKGLYMSPNDVDSSKVGEAIHTESTTVIETTEEDTAIAVTTVETVEATRYTFIELDKYMYCQGATNVRVQPELSSNISFSLETNRRVYVNGRCNETGWYRINIEGQTFYISDVMLADTEYVPPTTSSPVNSTHQVQQNSGFVYYVYSGREPSYDLEMYLWNQLNEVGIGWYYKYAVAQIAQESNWNPQSTNGRDHGLCQFKGIYWENRVTAAGLPGADIWNPYHQIYVYVRFMRGILAAVGNDVNKALSYYITGSPNEWHQSYIDHVMSRYNALTSK